MQGGEFKTEKDYERALARINDLMDADPGTPEGDELESLATMVELYEEENYPIDPRDPEFWGYNTNFEASWKRRP